MKEKIYINDIYVVFKYIIDIEYLRSSLRSVKVLFFPHESLFFTISTLYHKKSFYSEWREKLRF